MTAKYRLGQEARISLTKEVGTITQVCLNLHRAPDYRLRIDVAFGHSIIRAVAEPDLEPLT